MISNEDVYMDKIMKTNFQKERQTIYNVIEEFYFKTTIRFILKNMSIMIAYVCFWPRYDVEGKKIK